MSLFRRHKNFEEQLQKQLGDMEMKPSASLWDRIDSGMTSDSFEHGVRGRLENFELMPYPETWKKIEAELPEKAPASSAAKYYVGAALAVLFCIGVFIGQQWQPDLAKQESMTVSKDKTNGQSGVQIQLENPEAEGTMVVSEEHAPQTVIENKTEAQEKQAVVASNITSGLSYSNSDANTVVKIIETNTPVTQLMAVNTVAPEQPSVKAPVINEVQQYAVTTQQPVADTRESVATAKTPVEGNTTQDDDKQPEVLTEAHPTAVQLTQEVTIPVQQSQETQLSQTDSVADTQPVEVVNNRPDLREEELTNVSLSIYAGLNLSLTTYQAPKQASGLDFNKNINLRKELERPQVDWSGGFMADVITGKRWMVSAGVMMVNFSQRFEYSIEKALQPSENEWGAKVSNPTDSFVVGNSYSNQIKYSWTEVPVYVNYTFLRKQKWNFHMQAGLSYAFINLIDGGMIGYDNKGVLVLNDKQSFPNIQNTVFVTAIPQVSYQFSPTVAVGLAPSVKYSLTSIIGNDRWIQQHPYFIGMNICLRKRF